MLVEPYVEPTVRIDSLAAGDNFADPAPANAGKIYEVLANQSPDITVAAGKIAGSELGPGSLYAWAPEYMVVRRYYKAVQV